jgi:hypothetical protein
VTGVIMSGNLAGKAVLHNNTVEVLECTLNRRFRQISSRKYCLLTLSDLNENSDGSTNFRGIFQY